MKSVYSFILITIFALLLSACKSGEQMSFERQVSSNNQNVLYIKRIDSILEEHAQDDEKMGKYETTMRFNLEKLKKENPDNKIVKDMESQFLRDTGDKGVIYQDMKREYEKISQYPEFKTLPTQTPENAWSNKSKYSIARMQEIENFKQRYSVNAFDSFFIDYNNTLAAMSDNISPLIVDDVSKEIPASSFVGNDNYGEWKKDSNGNVYWEFFQTYMFMSMLSDINRPYYGGGYSYPSSYRTNYRYDNWTNNRSWSYYNDKYVKDYASTTEKRKYASHTSNYAKQYKSSIKPTTKSQTQVKKMATSKTAKAKQFSSNYAKTKYNPKPKTSTSKYSSGNSMRNSYGSKTSFRSGK